MWCLINLPCTFSKTTEGWVSTEISKKKKNQERKRYRIKETKNPTKTVKDGSQCKSQGANYTKQTGEYNPEKASTEVSSCKKQESDWWLIHLKYGKLYLDGMEGYKNT